MRNKLDRKQIRQLLLREMSYVLEQDRPGDEPDITNPQEKLYVELAKFLSDNASDSPLKGKMEYVEYDSSDKTFNFYQNEESFETGATPVLKLKFA